jgi:apolipoprotein D and lipocalin family protein
MEDAEPMRVRHAGLGVLLLLLAAGPGADADMQPLRVADAVNLAQFAGKWYEVARLPNALQRKCAGDVVVHYTLRADSRVDVLNQCRDEDGRLTETRGLARKARDGKNNAVLEVRFSRAILPFRSSWADYWILGLGPDYTWAVVGDPRRERLWILSRAPKMSASSYEQALEIANGNGFDTSRLVQTAHTVR